MKQHSSFSRTVVAGILLAAPLAFGFNAFAAEQNPCSEDIATFCKHVAPGPTLINCLEQHETHLSDACKEYEARMGGTRTESREAMRQQMRIRQACRNDVTGFCNGGGSTSGGVGTCLREHTDELSTACRDAIDAAARSDEETKKQ